MDKVVLGLVLDSASLQDLSKYAAIPASNLVEADKPVPSKCRVERLGNTSLVVESLNGVICGLPQTLERLGAPVVLGDALQRGSAEADIYPLAEPELADQIDGAIGEGSNFHDMVSLPDGWMDRVHRI